MMPEWEVDQIIDSLFRGRTLEYFARWVGFDEPTRAYLDEPAELGGIFSCLVSRPRTLPQ